MAESNQVYRFAVGASGNLRSGIFRLWTPAASRGKTDVYFNLRAMGEEGKVSLHADRGHIATSHTVATANALPSRFTQVWDRGLREGTLDVPDFELFVPTSELHPEPMEEDIEDDVTWIAPAPSGGCLRFLIVIHSSSLKLPPSVETLRSLPLGNGATCDLFLERYGSVPDQFVEKLVLTKRKVLAREPSTRIGTVDLMNSANRGFLGFLSEGGRRGFVEVHLAAGAS